MSEVLAVYGMCVLCCARLPRRRWGMVGRPSAVVLRVEVCGCRPVCEECVIAVGGWLQRHPCLLCGASCGRVGCSPLVLPRQPWADDEEPGGLPPLPQWQRFLRSAGCGDGAHRLVVPVGVEPGYGVGREHKVYEFEEDSEGEYGDSADGESGSGSGSSSESEGESVSEFGG